MSFLDLAFDAIEMGFYVFPLAENSKVTLKGSHGYKDATQNKKQIEIWNKQNPRYNIGFSTHLYLPPGQDKPLPLVAVDVDVRGEKRGRETQVRLELEGFEFSDTLTQVTASGGSHYIYYARRALRSGTGALGTNIDVCAFGRYLVGNGSKIHGKTYTFQNRSVRPQLVPEWIAKKLGEPPAERKTPREEKRAIEFLKSTRKVSEGERNAECLKVALHLRDMAITKSKAIELVSEYWNDELSSPLTLSEVSATVSNAFRYAKDSFGNNAPELQFDVIEEAADDKLDPIEELNKQYAYVLSAGKGHILWETTDAESVAQVQHLDLATFHHYLAARRMQISGTKTEPVTKLWMCDSRRRTYKGMCFLPEKKAAPGWYNLWRGFTVKPTNERGDSHESVQAFLQHAEQNVCKGDPELTRWLLGYFAHLIQKPWEKPLTAIVFKGKKGVGKNALVERVGYLLGNHFSVKASKKSLTGNFNAHLENSLFMVLDEAFWSGDPEANGILKHLVTGAKHDIERKGFDSYEIKNLTRVAIIGNEDWLVPASEDERRYAVFNVGEGRKKDNLFFRKMREGMEAGGYSYLLRYFLDFDLSTVDIDTIPMTEGLLEQKEASLSPFEEWWFRCLQDQTVIEELETWPDSITKSDLRRAFYEHLKQKNVKSRFPDSRVIGKSLLAVCPSSNPYRDSSRVGRKRRYFLPSLLQCRAEWETFIGHKVSWEED